MELFISRSKYYKAVILFLLILSVFSLLPPLATAKVTLTVICWIILIGFYFLPDTEWMEAKIHILKKIYIALVIVVMGGFIGTLTDLNGNLSVWKPITFLIMALSGITIWYFVEKRYVLRNVDVLRQKLRIDVPRGKLILPMEVEDMVKASSKSSKHEWWIYYTGGLLGVFMNGVLKPDASGIIIFAIALFVCMFILAGIGCQLADLIFIIKLEKETGKKFIAEDRY